MDATNNMIGIEKLDHSIRWGGKHFHREDVSLIFFRFCGLFFLTFTLIQGPGCSRVSVKKPMVKVEKGTGDFRADEAMRLEDYETSIRLHELFVEREPENELAMYHLGFSYGQTGNNQKEVFYYEKAIALGFKEDYIFFNLGMAQGELDQFEKAIQAFKQGLVLNPVNADNYFGLGLTYQKVGRNNAAERAFKKAIEIDPEHLDAGLYLSLLYADMGDFQKARQQLRQILEIDPSHMSARDLLDRIEKEEGERR